MTSMAAGPIPPELGGISTLYYLYLNDNQLTGESLGSQKKKASRAGS